VFKAGKLVRCRMTDDVKLGSMVVREYGGWVRHSEELSGY